jgi:hypothetical protein
VLDRKAEVRRCSFGECRLLAITADPLRFCVDHEREAAMKLGPLAGALEVERFLNSSRSTRYRKYGRGLNPPPRISRHRPVVYYMERGELIKIGMTTRIRKRAAELDAAVLAAEPGARVEEIQRHKQFAHLHHHHEWFNRGPDLEAHIAEIVERYGKPMLSEA